MLTVYFLRTTCRLISVKNTVIIIKDKINRSIFAIAVPAIVSNITTPVLGLVDVAIVGHIGAAAYIGAIAVGSTMFNMLYWLFGFLRMGTAGLTSQSCGAGDFHASSAHLRRALSISTCIALLLIIFSVPLGYAALDFIDADEVTTPLARRYFSIAIYGAPAVLGTYVMNGWLLGMQNTRTPMFVAIATNIVNIAVSVALVFVFKMKIEGVAIGTAFAQWFGFLCLIILIWRRYKPESVRFAEIIERHNFGRLFKINFDIFLRTLCLVAVTVWFTRAGAGQGVEILAANALLMQMFMFFSYFTDGFAFAGEALAGKYFGAREYDMLRAVVRRLLGWGIWLASGFTAIYFVGGEFIVKMLTDDSAVISTACEFLPWAVGIPLCGTVAFLYDGIFVGLTLTRRMLVSLIVGMLVFFAVYFSLHEAIGNHALWLAFLMYLLLRGVVLHLLFKIR